MSEGFSQVLNEYIEREDRTTNWLGRQTRKLFDGEGVAVPTIKRWKRGLVKKPRAWQDIIKLAVALRLTQQEVDRLLVAAGHASISQLAETVEETDAQLLSYWDSAKPPFQAPPDELLFTGRENLLHQLETLLHHPHSGIICCLHGMGGVGKTTLATHLAYRLRADFPDGVLWADCEKADVASILSHFALALSVDTSHHPTESSRSSKLRELLSDKQILIVLDDVGYELDVTKLLPPSGACAVLITTRYQDLALPSGTHRIPVDTFSGENKEALELFEKIVGESNNDDEQEARLAITERLGHLPLAIALVAHRLAYEPLWSAATFLQRLDQDRAKLNLLTYGSATVRALFVTSYELLTTAQKRFFVILAVFQGDFSVAAVAFVAEVAEETVEDWLRQLLKLSLLQVHQFNSRFQLHPLVREYGREQLQDSSIQHRMAHFYNDFLQSKPHNYVELDVEIANLRFALEVASEQQEPSLFIQFVIALFPYWRARGHYDLATDYLHRAEEKALAIGNKVGLIDIWLALGHARNKQGNIGGAYSYYEQAFDWAEQINDKQRMSYCLTSLGALSYRKGDLTLARSYYEDGISLAQAADEQQRLAILWTNMGLLAMAEGERDIAESYYLQALDLVDYFADKRQEIVLRQNLGSLYADCGNFASAETHFDQGLTLAQQIRDREYMSRMMGNLGQVSLSRGHSMQAKVRFQQGLDLAEQIKHDQLISRQLSNLGQMAMARQEYSKAHTHFEQAIEIARSLGFQPDICVMLLHQGECYRKEGKQWFRARTLLQEAKQIAWQVNLPKERGQASYGLAQIAKSRGKIQEAKQLAKESYEIFVAIGYRLAEEVRCWLIDFPVDEG